jgi:hypothetical protein
MAAPHTHHKDRFVAVQKHLRNGMLVGLFDACPALFASGPSARKRASERAAGPREFLDE